MEAPVATPCRIVMIGKPTIQIGMVGEAMQPVANRQFTTVFEDRALAESMIPRLAEPAKWGVEEAADEKPTCFRSTHLTSRP